MPDGPTPIGLTPPQKALVSKLLGLGQQHLFADWPATGTQEQEKAAFLTQLETLDSGYPGGLEAYIASARRLLGQSQRGENPLSGWRPSVPSTGLDLEPGTPEFKSAEERGLLEAGYMGFVVPAGGLGERLGFGGVKFALPAESSSGATVLEVYIGYILAVQRLAAAREKRSVRLPLAIMVSGDTEQGITALLKENGYYGLEPSQVTLLRQEKVAALRDADASIALADRWTVATKPHGHGDVHFLLHSSGTVRRWLASGLRWIMFFQDTNTLYFSTFLASVGASAQLGLAVNMIACPRKAKEAIGCVAQVRHLPQSPRISPAPPHARSRSISLCPARPRRRPAHGRQRGVQPDRAVADLQRLPRGRC